MPSQPCTKCGVDVDPEIQNECPSCGRAIKGASAPIGWVQPSWNEPQPDPGAADQQPLDTIPPPPPPVSTQPGRSRNWLGSIGVRIALGLLIFGGISAWNAVSSADRDDTGAIVEAGDVAANELAVGDCLLDPGEDVFEEVRGVACSEPHDFEVYHLATVSSLSYPSDTEFEDAAVQHCLPVFDMYTGESYETSDLWIGYFVPDSTAWSAGDRIMQCYLYLPDSMLTGSRAAG
ncbi:MAG: septum formation family protein [Acidimicrobiia bacterium]|nr:septum formation family protein [Acidimicrobiia bacterium]